MADKKPTKEKFDYSGLDTTSEAYKWARIDNNDRITQIFFSQNDAMQHACHFWSINLMKYNFAPGKWTRVLSEHANAVRHWINTGGVNAPTDYGFENKAI